MIGVRIDGNYIDLYPSTQVTFSLKSTIYNADDPSKIAGSFSFPFEVPLTQRNRLLLAFPDRIDSYDSLPELPDTWFYYQGTPMFKGTFSVISATRTSARCTLVIGENSKLGNLKLRDLNMGTYTAASGSAMKAHAESTTVTPTDQDYIFFPIRNFDYGVGEIMVNEWESSGFKTQLGVTPFVRLKPIMHTALEELGFSFVDNVFVTDEHERVVLYNNKSIMLTSESNGAINIRWPTTINLSDHLPDATVSDLVKGIANMFFAALMFDPFSNTFTLEPLAEIMAAPPVKDWTDRASYDYSVEFPAADYGVIQYYIDENDGFDTFRADFELYNLWPGGFFEVDKYDDIFTHAATTGLFYVRSLNLAYARVGSSTASVIRQLVPITSDSEGDTIKYMMSPLYNWQSFAAKRINPAIRHEGSLSYQVVDEDGEVQSQEVSGSMDSMRVTIYRGMVPDNDNVTYPMASSQNYDGDGNKISGEKINLLFNAEDSLVDDSWLFFLRNRKDVTRTMRLRREDILNHRSIHKVKIENMNYFVTEMRPTFTMDGIPPVPCKLATTL